MAILYQNKVIAGAKYLPALKELYYVKEGGGGFCSDKPKVVNTSIPIK